MLHVSDSVDRHISKYSDFSILFIISRNKVKNIVNLVCLTETTHHIHHNFTKKIQILDFLLFRKSEDAYFFYLDVPCNRDSFSLCNFSKAFLFSLSSSKSKRCSSCNCSNSSLFSHSSRKTLQMKICQLHSLLLNSIHTK